MFYEGHVDFWLMMKEYSLLKVVLVCIYHEDEMSLLQLQKTHSDDEAVFEFYRKVAEKEGTYMYIKTEFHVHVVSICYISECPLKAPYSHQSFHPSINLSISHLLCEAYLLISWPNLAYTSPAD